MDPLEHPEIRALFKELFGTLLNESDRGALLVGVEHVNNHLEELLEAVLPAGLGKKRRRELLSYPGPFSGFSTRIEAAYAFRLIPRRVYDALHALRKVRNAVAHSPDAFTLAGNEDQVHRIYDLGPDLPGGVQRLALEMMLEHKASIVLETVKSLHDEDPDSEAPIFKSTDDVVQFFRDQPDVQQALKRQVPLWELVIGISLLCSSIVYQRDRLRAALGPDELLSRILKA
jgi:hypothetical protein